MKRNPRILLRGLPNGGYPPDYRAILSAHDTVENAIHWGGISGLASDGDKRTGRVWIEKAGQPATLDTPPKEE